MTDETVGLMNGLLEGTLSEEFKPCTGAQCSFGIITDAILAIGQGDIFDGLLTLINDVITIY